MNYLVLPSSQWLYPDITQYRGESRAIEMETTRFFKAGAQVLLIGAERGLQWSCDLAGVNAEPMISVYVGANPGLEESNREHFPERRASFRVYDCIADWQDERVWDSNMALYVTFDPQGRSAGVYEGTLTVGELHIPINVRIRDIGTLPERLTILNNYLPSKAAEAHHMAENDERFAAVNGSYLERLREMHQTALYVPDKVVNEKTAHGYSFDFSELIAFCREAKEYGFKTFYLHALGSRVKWDLPTVVINGFPAMSFDAYLYAKAYLTALKSALTEAGFALEDFYMGVADEPTSVNAAEYCAVCALIKKFLPEIKLLDAVMIDSVYYGPDAVAVTPQTYLKRREIFDQLREDMQLWYYVALSPRKEGMINRFLDFPLLTSRYLHWANFRYGFCGYMHWAVNFYQPGQDPFEDTCCKHKTHGDVWMLPPGDTHIFYPGRNGPYRSMRSENERMGAEEYALFDAVAAFDPERAMELCKSAFREFDDFEIDATRFEEIRKSILRTAEKILQEDYAIIY